MMTDENKPTYLDVSSHFYTDATDFLKRFRYCYLSDSTDFSASRSLRMKCFIDLRMAFEASLKAIEAYFNLNDRSGKNLVNKIEGYGHKVAKLKNRTIKHVPDIYKDCLEEFGNDLKFLPIHLRYKLDVLDFYKINTDLYYRTIGSDSWVNKLYELTQSLTQFIGKELSNNSRVVNGKDLWEEYTATKYIKEYAPEKVDA